MQPPRTFSLLLICLAMLAGLPWITRPAAAFGPPESFTNGNRASSELELGFQPAASRSVRDSRWRESSGTTHPVLAGSSGGTSSSGGQEDQNLADDEAAAAPSDELPLVDPALLPPDSRPPDWPALPKEGGADGYADTDPLEGLNRVFFYVNGALDFVLFEPLARGFRFIFPDPVKVAVANAFRNLASPVVFANDLLQLEMDRAGNTLGRFLVNSTLGVAGLFDVASELGIEGHSADFGQTLHRYGFGDGIYLVLPLFGSTNVRDGIGLGVDTLMDPRNWLLDGADRLWLGVGEGVVRREQLLDPVDFLVENSEDNYDAVRAWNFQMRQRELYPDCERPTTTICSEPSPGEMPPKR